MRGDPQGVCRGCGAWVERCAPVPEVYECLQCGTWCVRLRTAKWARWCAARMLGIGIGSQQGLFLINCAGSTVRMVYLSAMPCLGLHTYATEHAVVNLHAAWNLAQACGSCRTPVALVAWDPPGFAAMEGHRAQPHGWLDANAWRL